MKNRKDTIRKFVGYLNMPEAEGGYWLPNIQRNFVWNQNQIERLYDSLLREYPIGTLLIWKTKSEIKRRKFIDNFKKNLDTSALDQLPDNKNKMLVLDGQQRLQSLFIGLKGSYLKNELYFNILSGTSKSVDDVKFEFKFLAKNRASEGWVKIKDLVFSDKKRRELKKAILSEFTRNVSEDEKDRIEENIEIVRDVFCTQENIVFQEIDSVDRPDTYKEDDIVEIFIRANSGGTKLGKSDLLFSLLSSSWEEANDQMNELLTHLNKTGFAFTRDFILKTCLTLQNKGAAYNVMKFRDTDTKNNIIKNWEMISKAIKDVKDFIYGNTFIKTNRNLPSYLTLIPLIYFRYHYPNKWEHKTGIEDYLLRTLISGSFSGSPDTLIDRCIRKINENKNFNKDEIFDVIKERGRSLQIKKETILGQNYGGKLIHLIFNLWYNFNYEPSYEDNQPAVDHIFPQSRLKKLKDINPRNGKRNIMRYKWFHRDQLANLMLLTRKENGAGGKRDILPEFWFADKSDEYLDKHLIPKNKELWKLENFESFIAERKKLIETKLNYLFI